MAEAFRKWNNYLHFYDQRNNNTECNLDPDVASESLEGKRPSDAMIQIKN